MGWYGSGNMNTMKLYEVLGNIRYIGWYRRMFANDPVVGLKFITELLPENDPEMEPHYECQGQARPMECSVISIYWLYRDENIFIPKSSVKADLFKQETVVQNIVEDTETRFSGGQYKEEYSLAGPALIRQLYACCADELKQGLSRSTGGG